MTAATLHKATEMTEYTDDAQFVTMLVHDKPAKQFKEKCAAEEKTCSSVFFGGYCAACAIISNLDNKQNVIEEYKRTVAETKNYMKRQWQLLGRKLKNLAL